MPKMTKTSAGRVAPDAELLRVPFLALCVPAAKSKASYPKILPQSSFPLITRSG
jgi:hypothetical protein